MGHISTLVHINNYIICSFFNQKQHLVCTKSLLIRCPWTCIFAQSEVGILYVIHTNRRVVFCHLHYVFSMLYTLFNYIIIAFDQVCHDRADNSEEWCLQFWGCSIRAIDREKTSRSHNAKRATESCYLGTYTSRYFGLRLSLILAPFYTTSDLKHCRQLQDWVRTKWSSVLIPSWTMTTHQRLLLRFALASYHIIRFTLKNLGMI